MIIVFIVRIYWGTYQGIKKKKKLKKEDDEEPNLRGGTSC